MSSIYSDRMVKLLRQYPLTLAFNIKNTKATFRIKLTDETMDSLCFRIKRAYFDHVTFGLSHIPNGVVSAMPIEDILMCLNCLRIYGRAIALNGFDYFVEKSRSVENTFTYEQLMSIHTIYLSLLSIIIQQSTGMPIIRCNIASLENYDFSLIYDALKEKRPVYGEYNPIHDSNDFGKYFTININNISHQISDIVVEPSTMSTDDKIMSIIHISMVFTGPYKLALLEMLNCDLVEFKLRTVKDGNNKNTVITVDAYLKHTILNKDNSSW